MSSINFGCDDLLTYEDPQLLIDLFGFPEPSQKIPIEFMQVCEQIAQPVKTNEANLNAYLTPPQSQHIPYSISPSTSTITSFELQYANLYPNVLVNYHSKIPSPCDNDMLNFCDSADNNNLFLQIPQFHQDTNTYSYMGTPCVTNCDDTSYNTTHYNTVHYDNTLYDNTHYNTTHYDTTHYDTTHYDTTHYDTTHYDMTNNPPMHYDLAMAVTNTPIPESSKSIKDTRCSSTKPSTAKRACKKRYNCEDCAQDFGRPQDLRRHMNAIHLKKKVYYCHPCNKKYYRKDALTRHLRNKKEAHQVE